MANNEHIILGSQIPDNGIFGLKETLERIYGVDGFKMDKQGENWRVTTYTDIYPDLINELERREALITSKSDSKK